MSLRMFSAIVPPEPVREELEEFIGPRRASDTRIRWAQPDQSHVTTLFIDHVPDRSVDRLLEGLSELAGRTRPFRVRLGGGGCFPDPISARVLYLATRQGVEELNQLSKTSRALASRAGAEPDGSKYVPHLTLARMRTRIEATKWLRVIDAFPGLSWQAGHLDLIASHLGEGPRGRPRYELVERFTFASTG